jgi:hypothetical protein
MAYPVESAPGKAWRTLNDMGRLLPLAGENFGNPDLKF